MTHAIVRAGIRFVTRLGPCSACLLLPLLACCLLQAQRAAPTSGDQPPVIRTTVRRVVVDVTVTDKNQQPVRGLTKADFTFTEDGVPQQALTFEAHDMDTSDSSKAVAPPHLSANTFVDLPAQPERGPLYVLLYDMGNTSNDEQMWARKELLKFMAAKPAGTRFAVLAFSDGLHVIQGFTDDPGKLAAALDPSGRVPHMPKNFMYAENYGGGNPYATVLVLEDIRHFVEGLPGRKNLVWVSERFPLYLFAPTPPDLIEQERQELGRLADDQVAVYPINTSLGSAWEQNIVEDEIAHLTGGRAIYGSNDLVGSLTQATDEGGSYYTLSYDPTNRMDDGKVRRLHVAINAKTAQPGLQLNYRREYYGDPPQGTPAADAQSKPAGPGLPPPAPDTLLTEMRHGWPMNHGLLFAAHIEPVGTPAMATPQQMADLRPDAAYFKDRQKHKAPLAPDPILLQAYTIDYTVPSHQLLQSGTNDPASAPGVTLEFAVAAFNAEEVQLNGAIDHAGSIDAGTKPTFRIEQPFLVPAGAAWIRLAVRDVDTGKIGSLEFSLPLAGTP